MIKEPVQSKLARYLEENPIDWDEVLSSQTNRIDENMNINISHDIKNFKPYDKK